MSGLVSTGMGDSIPVLQVLVWLIQSLFNYSHPGYSAWPSLWGKNETRNVTGTTM